MNRSRASRTLKQFLSFSLTKKDCGIDEYSGKSACSTRLIIRETLEWILERCNVVDAWWGKKRRCLVRCRFCFLHLCREASSAPRLCRAKKKERKGRKEEKGKSRRSSPSSKEAEEAFRAGLRIQSGRIIRSPAFIFISLSLSLSLSATRPSLSLSCSLIAPPTG